MVWQTPPDMVPKPIVHDGLTWYIQEVCGMDGNLKTVILYDPEGYPVAEFPDGKEAEAFLNGVIGN